MLLLSTMVIAPVSLTANAAGQHGITINHIFSDGYKAADSYDELYGSYEEGETPLVSIIAPYGYIIESVYFTTPTGADFSLFVEDLQYDNPVQGVYHITMPDYDLTMSVIYRCILNSVVVNHIYDGGHSDDADYQIVLSDDQIEGSTVNFAADPKAGYKLDTTYVLGYAGTSFATLLDLPINALGGNNYSLTMPNQPITINLVYTTNRHDITPVALFDGVEGVGEDYYSGPLTADPGETVVFYGLPADDYSMPEVYVTAGAGMDFVEVVEIEEAAGAYYFIMPDAPVTVHLLYTNAKFSITAGNIFEDGTVDDTVYYTGVDTACVGQRVMFTIDAPVGYAVKEIYGTYAAGTAFVEVFTIDSLAGAYYFDMPDGDVTIGIVYTATLFDVNFVTYKADVLDEQWTDADVAAGSNYVFIPVAPEGYAVDEIYAISGSNSAFAEIVPVNDLGNGAYSFDMPEADVDVVIVYKSSRFDVNYASFDNNMTLVDEWTDTGVAAGSTHVFIPAVPEGYAIDEVFAMSNVNGTFAEIIPVNVLGSGVFSFEMPEADVDVIVIFKSTRFDVKFAAYDGADLVSEWTETDVAAGEKYIFAVDAPSGYVVDEVIATTGVNDLFIEVLNVSNLAGAYYFDMPEADVDVTVIYRKITFGVTVNDIIDGAIVEAEDAAYDAGETVIIVAEAPAGYTSGYVVDTITAVSASDPSVEYNLDNISGNVYAFDMPEDDVVVEITWKANSHSVTITNVDENGAIIDSTVISDVVSGTTFDYTLQLANETIRPDYELVEYYAVVEVAPFHEMIDAVLNGTAISFTMPAGDVDVTAVWHKYTFTVTERYIENETEVIDALTAVWDVNAGDNWISIATIPDGYKISEVYVTAIDGAFAEFVDFIYLNDTTLYFEVPYGDVFVDYYIEKVVNTVNYYAYVDGELAVVYSEEVAYGEVPSWGAANTADDLPDGHVFIGWYNGAAEYGFADPLLSDLDLYAAYEFASCNVTFNSDGGSDVAAQTVIKNGKAVEPAAPAKEGFEFAGWQLNGVAYDFDTAVTEDIELTATWTEKTFTVTLPESEDYEVKTADGSSTTVPYGGSYSFTVDYADGIDGDEAVVTANGEVLTPDADGVYTIDDITSDVYISVSVPSSQDPVFYTVKFNYFHGNDEVSVVSRVEEGGSVTAPEDTARYTYNFLGWFDNAEGTGEAVTDFTNILADAEYFAVYEQNPVADYTFGEYTVTDSEYGIGFKEVKIEVLKNNAEYQDRDVYVIAAAQLKDGSTILFYVPVYVENGAAKADVSLILNSNTFEYVDMYIVYDEVDLSGSLNWVDIESGIQVA